MDKKRLQGKVAIVTGAGRGMGRAHALLLAGEGAKVVVNDLGGEPIGRGADVKVAHQVADEIRARGGEAIANTDSVASMEGAHRLINAAVESFGRLDTLINNAGIFRIDEIEHMTEEDWDQVIAVHLKGCFATIKYAVPIFKRQRSGVIVNIASDSGLGRLRESTQPLEGKVPHSARPVTRIEFSVMKGFSAVYSAGCVCETQENLR